jgi:two-component system catabolic regulation response regulator CreB
LASFADEAADLVVLDVGLPDGSGFDCCRELRRNSDVPIIFLTARDHEVDRILGLELGADDYLTKPFSPRELSARVRARLRRLPGGSLGPRDGIDANDTARGFSIDERRCSIAIGGVPLPLSAQQYRILRALAREPGRVFERNALLRAAEIDPELCEPRTVDSHIRDLRAILRRAGLDQAIVTHRGLGYSLSEQH